MTQIFDSSLSIFTYIVLRDSLLINITVFELPVCGFPYIKQRGQNSAKEKPFVHNTKIYVVGSRSFRPDQLFRVTEIKQLCYFST